MCTFWCMICRSINLRNLDLLTYFIQDRKIELCISTFRSELKPLEPKNLHESLHHKKPVGSFDPSLVSEGNWELGHLQSGTPVPTPVSFRSHAGTFVPRVSFQEKTSPHSHRNERFKRRKPFILFYVTKFTSYSYIHTTLLYFVYSLDVLFICSREKL